MIYEAFNMPTEKGGTISIIVPRPLTHKDMARFRDWIDLIEDAITENITAAREEDEDAE